MMELMRGKLLLVLCLIGQVYLSLVDGQADNYCGVNFAFANSYGSHMVLQRSPVSARIWGYGFAVGDPVTVSMSDGGSYETMTVEGSYGRPVWSVELLPFEEEGPFTISATSSDCTISLEDVLFGDVWFCSGQSNMVHKLNQIDNPQDDIDDVVNYPNIRTFQTALDFAEEPEEDVPQGSRNWNVTTPELISSFSGLCWLFGKNLFDNYQRPIGLIQSAFGGTRIEAWTSPDALDRCFSDGVLPMDAENGASVLFNAMINPFLRMPIYGAIWYQGEQNEPRPQEYSCAMREMITDWRQLWYNNTDSMLQEFPFGAVQLAPNVPGDIREGFPDIREAQRLSIINLNNVFMAVTIDLPDFDSPYGTIHPRYKRQIADRLALGAFAVAYNNDSSGPYEGPQPIIHRFQGETIQITFTGILEARGQPENNHGFQVCCTPDTALVCQKDTEKDGALWTVAGILSVDGDTVTISNPCVQRGVIALLAQYSWLESPCNVLEECPLYADETGNNLPVGPYTRVPIEN